MTAGKLLHDLQHSTGAVSTVDFHPNEFLLASGGGDGTIRFWDLEVFEQVSSTGEQDIHREMADRKVQTLSFTLDGRALLAGNNSGLSAWGWEPAKCLDSFPSEWQGLCDIPLIYS